MATYLIKSTNQDKVWYFAGWSEEDTPNFTVNPNRAYDGSYKAAEITIACFNGHMHNTGEFKIVRKTVNNLTWRRQLKIAKEERAEARQKAAARMAEVSHLRRSYKRLPITARPAPETPVERITRIVKVNTKGIEYVSEYDLLSGIVDFNSNVDDALVFNKRSEAYKVFELINGHKFIQTLVEGNWVTNYDPALDNNHKVKTINGAIDEIVESPVRIHESALLKQIARLAKKLNYEVEDVTPKAGELNIIEMMNWRDELAREYRVLAQTESWKELKVPGPWVNMMEVKKEVKKEENMIKEVYDCLQSKNSRPQGYVTIKEISAYYKIGRAKVKRMIDEELAMGIIKREPTFRSEVRVAPVNK